MTAERTPRRRGAELLRQFLAGEITNDEFDQSFPRSESDLALRAIFRAVWMTYSDLREHRLTGKHAPIDEVRLTLERCRLFLTTDLPFEWPEPRIGILTSMLHLLTLGSTTRRSAAQLRRLGDVAYWPFIRESDYTAALTNERH